MPALVYPIARAMRNAASINWALKDGLGRLGRLGVAARFGESFDSDLKVRWRRAEERRSLCIPLLYRSQCILAFSPHPPRRLAAQRFRMATSLLYAAALSLEYATPLAPAHFLPMAALANVGKSVGLTTFIATQVRRARGSPRVDLI